MRKPGYSAALSCVRVRAESAARELGSGVTGTEHLLLALAQEKISSVGKILICQGAEGRLLRCMLLTVPTIRSRSLPPCAQAKILSLPISSCWLSVTMN